MLIMARVLGVHGIAQQYQGGPALARTWLDALRGGLEVAGFRATADGLADSDVRVAFFGDLFRPPGAMAADGPPYAPADVEPGREMDMLRLLYEAAIEQDPSLAPPPGAMGPGRVAAQIMLERLLRSPSFARVAQRGFIGNLKQVTAFLDASEVKDRILLRVANEITEDTQVIIGHSLGSIVVYEYLARYYPPQVELLVTLGSPLGIPNLVFERLTPSPVRGTGIWPGIVSKWVNIAAPDDVVALRKRLAPLFGALAGKDGIEDCPVNNGKEPHSVVRYLNAKLTGAALGEVL